MSGYISTFEHPPAYTALQENVEVIILMSDHELQRLDISVLFLSFVFSFRSRKNLVMGRF